jgi:hypothetical protein
VLEFPTIPTKIYEALASGVPMIVIAPEIPELYDLLNSYAKKYYYIHLEAKAQEIAMAIKKLAPSSKKHIFRNKKYDKLRNDLEIRPLTQKLAQIFDRAQR